MVYRSEFYLFIDFLQGTTHIFSESNWAETKANHILQVLSYFLVSLLFLDSFYWNLKKVYYLQGWCEWRPVLSSFAVWARCYSQGTFWSSIFTVFWLLLYVEVRNLWAMLISSSLSDLFLGMCFFGAKLSTTCDVCSGSKTPSH